MVASWASAGLMTAIVLRCLWCRCHHLVSLLPLLPVLASSLFGVLVAIVAIVAVIPVIAVVALFAPDTNTHATFIVTLAVVAAWFL
jgi:hypothetical protein